MNIESIIIRKERSEDHHAVEAMVRRSFYNKHKPGCDEPLFVRKLREADCYLPECSRVAEVNGEIAGVIMYFRAEILAPDGTVQSVASFGPLSVDHRWKNHGIGRQLLEQTLPLVKTAGFPGILIFGEPEYYPKHGFIRAGELGLTDMEGHVFDPFMAYVFDEQAMRIPGGRFHEPDMVENLSNEEAEQMDAEFEWIPKAIRPCQWTYENATDEKQGYHLEYAVMHPCAFSALFADYHRELNPDAEQNLTPVIEKLFSSVYHTAYVLFVKGQPAGLLVTSVAEPGDADQSASFIEECYLIPSVRGKGFAKDLFLRFIRQQKGLVGFTILHGNDHAKAVWEHLLLSASLPFSRVDEGNHDRYTVHQQSV